MAARCFRPRFSVENFVTEQSLFTSSANQNTPSQRYSLPTGGHPRARGDSTSSLQSPQNGTDPHAAAELFSPPLNHHCRRAQSTARSPIPLVHIRICHLSSAALH